MTDTEMRIVQLISTGVACLMLAVSWRSRPFGRFMFIALFAWAAQLNVRTALTAPEVYLEYAPLAWSSWYRDIILGPFARHITPVVAAIGVGQAAIAVGVSLRGRAAALGLIAAVVFLLAVAPLGIGSGFPATVIMALAALKLLDAPYATTLWQEAAAWVRIAAGRLTVTH
jgi:hypothetical protein